MLLQPAEGGCEEGGDGKGGFRGWKQVLGVSAPRDGQEVQAAKGESSMMIYSLLNLCVQALQHYSITYLNIFPGVDEDFASKLTENNNKHQLAKPLPTF